jgi:hypothetical protein
MNDSPINELAKALSVAQGAFQNPLKDGTNPHFKSRYATLDALQDATRKVLSENGLSITQGGAQVQDGTWVLETVLMHSSGQSKSNAFPLLMFAKGAQAAGSEITYMRRYAYASILNITAEEDDDANGAQNQWGEDRSKPPQGREYKLNPVPVAQAPTGTGESERVGAIGNVRAWDSGDGWSLSIGDFGGKAGEAVWTKEKSMAMALIKEQGTVIHAHLRSKKAGSYQLVSYIPAEQPV